jgi:hypothetical protein
MPAKEIVMLELDALESEQDNSQPTKALSWHGQKVIKTAGTLNALRRLIPYFMRANFALGAGNNLYLDQIIRQPISQDENPIPVATVSKHYVLIQHHDVLNAMEKALRTINLEPDFLRAELKLSEYGERMEFCFDVPCFTHDPGDGQNIILRIYCLNSVDKSTALELGLSWYRLVCSNGMIALDTKAKLRRIHLGSLDIPEITEFLNEEIKSIGRSVEVYSGWNKVNMSVNQFEQWADNKLADSWGTHLAARACHIARRGRDGRIADPFEKALPHEKRITEEESVPGAIAPISNAYHAYQVLTWLASHRPTMQDRFIKSAEVPRLMKQMIAE